MLEKHWWRMLQILTPIVVLLWLGTVVPKPEFTHTEAWTEAQAKQASYQYDGNTDTGVAAIRALVDSAEKMVDDESTKIGAITDPLQRLTAMSAAEVRLTRMMSKHPMWPGPIVPWLETALRQAGGLEGMASDPAIIRVAQNHTELLGAAFNEQQQLMKEYGFGVSEPISLTAPYYLAWTLRWLLLLTLA